MTTEPKNEIESLLSNLKFQTYSAEEIELRERAAKEQKAAEKAREYLSKANLPPRHRNASPKELTGAPWLELLASITEQVGTGFILGVIGPRGTGKTQLAVQIAKAAARAGKRPFYSTAMGFFLDIKEGFREKGNSEKQIIEQYTAPGLLILDEMQERGETPWEDRLLTHLVDKRYGAQRDTLLISNQTRENFLASIGESIASRIVETGGVTTCNWKSYRTI